MMFKRFMLAGKMIFFFDINLHLFPTLSLMHQMREEIFSKTSASSAKRKGGNYVSCFARLLALHEMIY
jgi:hypothetical protein